MHTSFSKENFILKNSYLDILYLKVIISKITVKTDLGGLPPPLAQPGISHDISRRASRPLFKILSANDLKVSIDWFLSTN